MRTDSAKVIQASRELEHIVRSAYDIAVATSSPAVDSLHMVQAIVATCDNMATLMDLTKIELETRLASVTERVGCTRTDDGKRVLERYVTTTDETLLAAAACRDLLKAILYLEDSRGSRALTAAGVDTRRVMHELQAGPEQ